MSVILTLEDGRQLEGSTLGMAGMFTLISDVMPAEAGKLKLWLGDLENRCAPFLDFDMRGMPISDRELFYTHAEIAFENLKFKFGNDVASQENHFSARCLSQLLKMKASIKNGEPPETLSDAKSIVQFDGEQVDYDQIWGKDPESA